MLKEERECGIYVITEIATGRQYVGQTRGSFERRWKGHHKRFPLQTHTYEVLTQCQMHELDELEKYYIEKLGSRAPNGYNLSKGGNKTWSRSWSKEERKRQATRQHTKMKALWEDEKYRTQFVNNSSRVSRKNWSNEDYREKMTSLFKKRWSEDDDYRRKVSESCKKTWSNVELRKKHSQKMKETFKDPEIRLQRSQTSKKLWEDEEYRRKVLEATKKGWSDPAKRAVRSLQRKGVPAEIVECPHCNTKGGIHAMKRWHFGHCKMLLKK